MSVQTTERPATAAAVIPSRIGALDFTHGFETGYPTDETIARLYDERDFQRACQTYIWSLPLVSFAAWRAGQESLGIGDCDLGAFLSYDDKRGILTANGTTPYYLAFFDVSAGPVVVELPADGVRGGVIDAWQTALHDCQGPGPYVFVGPGQAPPADLDGYALRSPATNGLMLGVRLMATGPDEKQAALEAVRVYSFDRRADHPPARLEAAADRPWTGVPPRGVDYWRMLAGIIGREPIAPRDVFFHDMLRPLGIAAGKAFAPDARQRKLLEDGALVGEAMAKANTCDRRFDGMMYRPDARWHYALQLDADEPDAFWDMLDERASWFYEAVSAAADMAPKRPGPSSAYLGAYRDRDGAWLDGGRTYRLRVPPDAPIQQFWSLTLYDVDTRALILNDEKIADRSSRMDLSVNSDGSTDLYCGPAAPVGFEQNWIPTVPGKNWFAYFRLYAPTQPYFDKAWALPDFERLR